MAATRSSKRHGEPKAVEPSDLASRKRKRETPQPRKSKRQVLTLNLASNAEGIPLRRHVCCHCYRVADLAEGQLHLCDQCSSRSIMVAFCPVDTVGNLILPPGYMPFPEDSFDPRRGRNSLVAIDRLAQSARNGTEVVSFMTPLRLFSLATITRTAWRHMPDPDRVATLQMATNNTHDVGCSVLVQAMIGQLVPMLDMGRRFQTAVPMGPQDNEAEIAASVINSDISMLLFRGVTFFDDPLQSLHTGRLIQGIAMQTLANAEISTKMEMIAAAKVVFPRIAFLAPSDVLASMYKDVETQLVADGLMVQNSSWVSCTQWADTMSLDNFLDAYEQTAQADPSLDPPSIAFDVRPPFDNTVAEAKDYYTATMFADPNGVVLAGAANYQWTTAEHETILAVENAAKAFCAPPDDDVHLIISNRLVYVKRVFQAMTTLPANASKVEQDHFKTWHNSIYGPKRHYTLAAVARAAYFVVEEVTQQSLYGVRSLCKGELIQGIRKDLPSTQKLQHVIDNLLDNKCFCRNIMNHAEMRCIVAAPQTVSKRKRSEFENNERRRKNKQAATEGSNEERDKDKEKKKGGNNRAAEEESQEDERAYEEVQYEVDEEGAQEDEDGEEEAQEDEAEEEEAQEDESEEEEEAQEDEAEDDDDEEEEDDDDVEQQRQSKKRAK